MADTHDTGKTGEELAKAHYQASGYEILETNWKSNHQEIDIIATKGDILVVAEVKTRKTSYFGEPETFVTRQKQKMLIKAANHYVISKGINKSVRFDIISVLIHGDNHRLNHIEDAFYPY